MSPPSDTPRDMPWTIATLLLSMQTFLTSRKVQAARLDAEVLLSHVLGVNRVYLYTHFDQPITDDERDTLRALIKRRAVHEPIAYICGTKEFYSRDFKVNKDVLIPRPETEHVVEAVLAWAASRRDAPLRILDIGTGSGALAVTLAKELPRAEVWATDISAEALVVAQGNAATHDVLGRVQFAQGDLFDALGSQCEAFDIIVSNPPYIAQNVAGSLPADVVRFEPSTALFGGADGLSILRRLCPEARRFAAAQSCLAIEIGYDQRDAVRGLLADCGWDGTEVVTDLQGHPRVIVAQRGARPAVQVRHDEAPDDQRDHHGLTVDESLPVFDVDTSTARERAL